jgi:HSP20 family protein
MPDNAQRPLHGLFDMFAELNRMREQWTEIEPSQGRTHTTAWVPALDIFARGADLVIRCELAGVSREELEVSLSDGQLWISGERTGAPEDGPGVGIYVRELRYGPFRRSINLPERIDSERIGATIVDGLLEIVVEGAAEPRKHERIEIAGADAGDVKLDVGRRVSGEGGP